jgi:hypothetical protein
MFKKLKLFILKKLLAKKKSIFTADDHEKIEAILLEYLIGGSSYDKEREEKTIKAILGRAWLDSIVGVVCRNVDHAGMTIFAEGKERFLVTSESIELMEPKEPCFQTNMQKIQSDLWPLVRPHINERNNSNK